MKSHEINGGKKEIQFFCIRTTLVQETALLHTCICSPFPIPVYLKDKLYCKDVCQRNSGKL